MTLDCLQQPVIQLQTAIARSEAQLEMTDEEKHMPFVSTPERIGRKIGLKEGIREFLTFRFPDAAPGILREILALEDHEILEKVLHAIRTVETPEQLRALWQQSSTPGQTGPATNA
jgi:hypothetical protein